MFIIALNVALKSSAYQHLYRKVMLFVNILVIKDLIIILLFTKNFDCICTTQFCNNKKKLKKSVLHAFKHRVGGVTFKQIVQPPALLDPQRNLATTVPKSGRRRRSPWGLFTLE